MDKSTQYVLAEIPNSNLRVVIDSGVEYNLEVKFSYANGNTFVLDDTDVVTLWIKNQNKTNTNSIIGARTYYNKAKFNITRDLIDSIYSYEGISDKSTVILNADIVIESELGRIIPNSEAKDTINIVVRGR